MGIGPVSPGYLDQSFCGMLAGKNNGPHLAILQCGEHLKTKKAGTRFHWGGRLPHSCVWDFGNRFNSVTASFIWQLPDVLEPS